MSTEHDIDWAHADEEATVLAGMDERERVYRMWKTQEPDFVHALAGQFEGDFHEWLLGRISNTDFLDDWFRRTVEAKDVKGEHLDVYALADRMNPTTLYGFLGGKGPAMREFLSRKLDVFTGGTMPPINVFIKLLKQKFSGDADMLRHIELLSDQQLLRLYDDADTGFHWTMNKLGYMTATPHMLQDAVDLISSGHIRAIRHEPGWAEEQPSLKMDVPLNRGAQMPLFAEGAEKVAATMLEADEDVDWEHVSPDDPDAASQATMKKGHESAADVYEDNTVRVIKPLNASTYNAYAELANIKAFSGYPQDLKEDDYLTFIAIPKLSLPWKQSPIFLEFDSDGKPDSSTMGWLDRSQVRSELDPLVASLRRAMSGYASKKRREYVRAEQKSDYSYSDQIRAFTTMLLTTGDERQLFPLLKKEYPDPTRSPMETHLAWPLISNLFARGKVKQAREVMRYARIGDATLKFEKDGFWVTWPDWNDLTHFFDKSSKKAAEQLFGGDAYQWFDSSHIKWDDMWDRLNPKSIQALRDKLVGMPWGDEDGRTRYHTPDSVAALDEDDLKTMLEDNPGDFDDVTTAIERAAMHAEESASESAYMEGYQGALENALGANKHAWVSFDSNKKDEAGAPVQVSRLAFFFPYTIVKDWLDYSDDNGNDGREAGDFTELAYAGSERVSPREDYSHRADFDDEYFNERFQEELDEVDLDWPAPDNSDPNQPELIPQEVTVKIYNEHYPNGATVRMTKEQAEAFAKEHPEQMSKEAWDAHANKPTTGGDAVGGL